MPKASANYWLNWQSSEPVKKLVFLSSAETSRIPPLLLQTTPLAGEKVRPHSPRPRSLTLFTDIIGRTPIQVAPQGLPALSRPSPRPVPPAPRADSPSAAGCARLHTIAQPPPSWPRHAPAADAARGCAPGRSRTPPSPRGPCRSLALQASPSAAARQPRPRCPWPAVHSDPGWHLWAAAPGHRPCSLARAY